MVLLNFYIFDGVISHSMVNICGVFIFVAYLNQGDLNHDFYYKNYDLFDLNRYI